MLVGSGWGTVLPQPEKMIMANAKAIVCKFFCLLVIAEYQSCCRSLAKGAFQLQGPAVDLGNFLNQRQAKAETALCLTS